MSVRQTVPAAGGLLFLGDPIAAVGPIDINTDDPLTVLRFTVPSTRWYLFGYSIETDGGDVTGWQIDVTNLPQLDTELIGGAGGVALQTDNPADTEYELLVVMYDAAGHASEAVITSGTTPAGP